MAKKVLIIATSAGAGHIRAAQALEAAFHEIRPGLEILNIDALAYVLKPVRRIYAGGYLAMVNKTPTLWGYLYETTDREDAKSKTKQFFEFLQNLNANRLLRFVGKTAPDHIVCTHFLPVNVLSGWMKKKGIEIPLSVVMTDFDVHELWVNPGVKHYFVATDVMAWKLVKRGLPPESVSASGIPIHPTFLRRQDRRFLREKFGLDVRTPTVAILSGGFGLGQVDRVLTTVLEAPIEHRGIQVIVVAGRNKALKAKIDSHPVPKGSKVISFGFIENMEEVMEVSDLLVTKPGGLTASEALAKGLPMLIVFPIPGQEARNSDYLLEHCSAVKAQDFEELQYKVAQLLGNPARLKVLRERALAIAKPRACFTIAQSISESLE